MEIVIFTILNLWILIVGLYFAIEERQYLIEAVISKRQTGRVYEALIPGVVFFSVGATMTIGGTLNLLWAAIYYWQPFGA